MCIRDSNKSDHSTLSSVTLSASIKKEIASTLPSLFLSKSLALKTLSILSLALDKISFTNSSSLSRA